jgi:hypothetical protein
MLVAGHYPHSILAQTTANQNQSGGSAVMPFLIAGLVVLIGVLSLLRWFTEKAEREVLDYYRSMGLSEKEIQDRKRRREDMLKCYCRDIDPD